MVVGIGIIEIFIGESRSLKEKRSVLRKVIHRTQNTFSLTVAEVGSQDNWKRGTLGFAVIGNDRGFIESKMESIERFIEQLHLVEVIDLKKEVLNISHKIDGRYAREGRSDDD